MNLLHGDARWENAMASSYVMWPDPKPYKANPTGPYEPGIVLRVQEGFSPPFYAVVVRDQPAPTVAGGTLTAARLDMDGAFTPPEVTCYGPGYMLRPVPGRKGQSGLAAAMLADPKIWEGMDEDGGGLPDDVELAWLACVKNEDDRLWLLTQRGTPVHIIAGAIDVNIAEWAWTKHDKLDSALLRTMVTGDSEEVAQPLLARLINSVPDRSSCFETLAALYRGFLRNEVPQALREEVILDLRRRTSMNSRCHTRFTQLLTDLDPR